MVFGTCDSIVSRNLHKFVYFETPENNEHSTFQMNITTSDIRNDLLTTPVLQVVMVRKTDHKNCKICFN